MTSTLDLRTIKAKTLSGVFDSYGGTIYCEWSSEVAAPGTDKEPLLLNDDVADFFNRFMDRTSNNEYVFHVSEWRNMYDGIGCDVTFEHRDEIAGIRVKFRNRCRHLMTCISWRVCPLCEAVDYKFINPDYLDTVWHDTSHCDCEDYQITSMNELLKCHAAGDIDDDELEVAKEKLCILVDENDQDEVVEIGVQAALNS